jgi:hypothetical protein
MQKPTTVKELFTPLNERLFAFESGRYLQEANRFIDQTGLEGYDEDHSKLVYNIGRQASQFNPLDVYNEAITYVERIKAIIESLEPVQYEYVTYDHDDLQDMNGSRPTTEEQKKIWMERHQRELSGFLKDLEAVLRVREGVIHHTAVPEQRKQEAINVNQPVIELPENFTVTQLNKHFDPQLSVNQAALFLYYLREQAILPSYSDSAIGKLAEAFFVRNQKNITKSISDIYTVKRNKDDLKALKLVLDKLLKEIDTDLKEAR